MLLLLVLLRIGIPGWSQITDPIPPGHVTVQNWPFGSPKEILDKATSLIIKYQKTKDIRYLYQGRRQYQLLELRNDSFPLVTYSYKEIPDTIVYLRPRSDTLYARGNQMILSTHDRELYELYRLKKDTIGWTVKLYPEQSLTSLKLEDLNEQRTAGEETITQRCLAMTEFQTEPPSLKYFIMKESGPSILRTENRRWSSVLKT